MKFFNARIVTKTVQLADALKASEKKQERTLDEILADVKAKGQVKTAAAEVPQVKTASSEVQVKTAEKAEAKAEPKAEVVEAKSEPKVEKKAEAVEVKAEPKSEEKEKKAEAKASPRILKMAKSLDFRNWEANDVVTAWGQHGSFEKCVANVDGLVNEPKTYCKLLQVAGEKAAAIVKTASKNQPEVKKAAPKGVFKKLAKLTDEELAFLKDYWRKLYGDDYVENMTKDF